MANQSGTLQTIVTILGRIFQPLLFGMQPDQIRGFMAQLGYPISDAQATAIGGAGSSVSAKLSDFFQATTELGAAVDADDTDQILEKGVEAIAKLVPVIASFVDLKNAIDGLGLAGITPAEIAELPARLLNYLLVVNMQSVRGLNELLGLGGILEQTQHNVDSTDPNNPEYTVSVFHFDKLFAWFQKPGDQLETLYQWGDPTFDGSLLFPKLENLIASTGLPVIYTAAPPRLDVIIFELRAPPSLNPRGILLGFNSQLNSVTISFDSTDFSATLAVGVTAPSGTGVSIQPDGHIGFIPPDSTTEIDGEVKLDVATKTGPYVLLGQPGGSRFELGNVGFGAGTSLTWSPGDGKASGSFQFQGQLQKGLVFIDASQGDGFLTTLLGGSQIQGNFDLTVGYSSKSGFYIEGSSTLEIRLPMHIDLGPISFQALTMAVKLEGGEVDVGLGADISAELGPLSAVVQNLGVKAAFSLPNGGGNLGPLQVDIGFQPPNGVGLAIDAGIVVGGGFLYLDPDKGEYAGVAELSIADVVTVKAIGLITTKMPDGSSGFSLLLILTTDFPPIQLGFGFTLNGVGGLLGLNRSVQLDVLRDGVRTGAVEEIVFPTDIIANAPRIISDLKAIFPPQQNVFLVGPMAKFGWGDPSLVTLSLGIILEIPPGNIAILGVLQVALPTEDEALILIQVAFLGILDFDEQLLSFDASLYDSHVLFMTLEGDMAVRLKWGDNAAFILSVGGFHPAFHPPDGLHLPASMKRLSISILDYDWAKIKVDCYFAVTSNTVQFGAHLYLFFGVDSANLSGQLGLDVLFQFSPFMFIAQISGSLSISVFGMDLMSIGLNFQLQGPTPWEAKGTGSLSFLFFSISISFDVTWGESKDTSLPPVDVMPIFLGEVNKQSNWKALPPPSTNLLVTLRAVDPSLLVLHPFGSLTLSQRALPLNLTLDKVGNQQPDDVNKVDITIVASNGDDLHLDEQDEQFAIAQFQNMSDSDKLSRPSYQEMKGGVIIGSSDSMKSSKMTRRNLSYDITIIDKEPQQPLPRGRFYGAISGLFHPFLSGSAAARSAVSYQNKSQLTPFTDKISVGQEKYAVSNTSDNIAINASASFSSEAMARDYMNSQAAKNPSAAAGMHVLPKSEVNAS
jgi:hypothetical protein